MMMIQWKDIFKVALCPPFPLIKLVLKCWFLRGKTSQKTQGKTKEQGPQSKPLNTHESKGGEVQLKLRGITSFLAQPTTNSRSRGSRPTSRFVLKWGAKG